ncbi:hypothetical protein LIER_20350 [Lithospermum erythrorhizon]|uniref:GAG-pre-integrase domain-containing protein n=1 Tax=Lithospermum erythrorhizon TaxID=34254 RepID=A0AAV3QL73_LITER
MNNEKLVRKVLRTLPKRFGHKVTAIEEAQDLTTMSLDELIGNLATFEISLNEGDSSKKKSIALKVSSEDVNDEDLGETINMLTKFFNKTLKRFNKKPFSGGVNSSITDRNNNMWKKPTMQGNAGPGLTANLIRISQLCDDGMKVSFCKEGCTVDDSCAKPVMHGTRSTDNCYMWSSVYALSSRKDEDADLWHRRLGHSHYRNIQQIVSKEAVRGIPRIEVKEKACGECQTGKQTKSCHPKLQQVVTTLELELMHMDLMRPMQDTQETVKLFEYSPTELRCGYGVYNEEHTDDAPPIKDTWSKDSVGDKAVDVVKFESLRSSLDLCVVDQ